MLVGLRPVYFFLLLSVDSVVRVKTCIEIAGPTSI